MGAQIGDTGEEVGHRGEHDDQRDAEHAGRQQPAGAAGVERAGRHAARALLLTDQQGRDQKTRKCEEHGHAQVPTGEARYFRVKGEHREHRDCAHPIERRLVRDRRATPHPRRSVRTRPTATLRSMRRLPRLATAFVGAITVSLAVAIGPGNPAHAAPIEIYDPRSGPLGAVTVIGDSILMGAALYSPTLPSELVGQGWGPVRLRAGEGYSTGQFPVEQSFRSSYWITLWRSQGWDAPNVIVNLGANDSGFCDVDLSCARAAIMHLVDTIGPGHKIWWPQITRLYTHRGQQDNWNLALQQIADERADFYTWDWPTVMETGPFPSSDGTHLAPDGYKRRSALMAEVFTDDIAVATRTGVDAPLPQPLGAPSRIRAAGPAAHRRHPQQRAGKARCGRHAHRRSQRQGPRRDDGGRRQPDGDPTPGGRLPHRPSV